MSQRLQRDEGVGVWKSFIDVGGAKSVLQHTFLAERKFEMNHEISKLDQLLVYADERTSATFNVVIHDQTLGCTEGIMVVTSRQLIIAPLLYYYRDFY